MDITINMHIEIFGDRRGRDVMMEIARLESDDYTIVPESLRVHNPEVLDISAEYGEIDVYFNIDLDGFFDIESWADLQWLDWNSGFIFDVQNIVRVKSQQVNYRPTQRQTNGYDPYEPF